MSKRKALLCTGLFVIAIVVILVLSSFLRNEKLGVDLFHIIIYSAVMFWFNDLAIKFYKWLRSE